MAAFVAGVAPSALRAASSPALCGSAVRPAPAPAAGAGRVRMAFSSLDRPETAVRSVSGDLEAMDLTVRAVYKQVFGNAYLMEEEVAGLAVAESQFREVHGSVREFIRDLAKSEQYKKRYLETAGPYRYVWFLDHFVACWGWACGRFGGLASGRRLRGPMDGWGGSSFLLRYVRVVARVWGLHAARETLQLGGYELRCGRS